MNSPNIAYNKLLILLVALALASAGFFGAGAGAARAESKPLEPSLKRELPSGMFIADDKGIKVAKKGTYFIDAQNLRPGEVVTKTLTIRNDDRDTPFQLTMTATPGRTSGPDNLLDKVKLELMLDGRTVYTGRARGDENPNMVTGSVSLGSFEYGKQKTLLIRLTVAEDVKRGWTKSEAELGWQFYAARDSKGAGPKTGVTDWLSPFTAAAAMFFAMSLWLLQLKRRREALA